MSEILYSKSVSLRSDREVAFAVWYGPKHPLTRDACYRHVSAASMGRVARLINRSFYLPERQIGTCVSMYSDCNFGIRCTFYTWSD